MRRSPVPTRTSLFLGFAHLAHQGIPTKHTNMRRQDFITTHPKSIDLIDSDDVPFVVLNPISALVTCNDDSHGSSPQKESRPGGNGVRGESRDRVDGQRCLLGRCSKGARDREVSKNLYRTRTVGDEAGTASPIPLTRRRP